MAYSHAGGVVVRLEDGERRYLLVRSSGDAGDWVLPKGHIDPGESLEQAALREVREEAGVDATIVARAGVDVYTLGGQEVRSVYFAMRFVESCPPDEDREICWLSFPEACETISFTGARKLIEQTHRIPL